MGASTISCALPLASPRDISTANAFARRRRRIDARAGHALEKLGHAIEYLTDEFVSYAPVFSISNPQLEAVQLLMALNRQIYFECPEVPSLGERWRSFWVFVRHNRSHWGIFPFNRGLLPDGQHRQQQQPQQAHGVPEPCGCVDGNLTILHALEPSQ